MNISNQDWWRNHGYDYDKISPILNLEARRRKEIMDIVDNHHIIGKANGGTDHSRNQKDLPRKKHVAHNEIHGDELPHEQIEATADFNAPVLSKHTQDVVRQMKDSFHTLWLSERMYIRTCWNGIDGMFKRNRFSMGPKPDHYHTHD